MRLARVELRDFRNIVTTAHPGWLARLNGSCRRFRVAGGRVTPAA